MPEPPDLTEVGSRIEELLQELLTAADPAVSHRAEELVRLLMELYGGALERVVGMASEHGETGRALLERLTSDELLSSLLVLHGLHPVPTEERVQVVLDRLGPELGLGGGVELLGVDDSGIAHIRLGPGCDGSPLSAAARLALEGGIDEAAPEVGGLEVEGPPTQPPPSVFIPAGALRHRPGGGAARRRGDGTRPAAVGP
jgi:Fe-S cluster biogenesis protein NfuA